MHARTTCLSFRSKFQLARGHTLITLRSHAIYLPLVPREPMRWPLTGSSRGTGRREGAAVRHRREPPYLGFEEVLGTSDALQGHVDLGQLRQCHQPALLLQLPGGRLVEDEQELAGKRWTQVRGSITDRGTTSPSGPSQGHGRACEIGRPCVRVATMRPLVALPKWKTRPFVPSRGECKLTQPSSRAL